MGCKIVEGPPKKEKIKMTRKIHKIEINNSSIVIIALLILLFLFSFGWGFGYMGGMMFFGPLFMIFVLVLIIWLVVSLTQKN